MRLPSLRWLSVLALLIVCGIAAIAVRERGTRPVVTGPVRSIVSFGDSLSDVGTYNPAAVHPDPAARSATGQRFTTKPGEVWVEVVADELGLAVKPNQQVDFGPRGHGGRIVELDGTGYAQGGAHIDVDGEPVPAEGAQLPDESLQGATAISIKTQIDRYLAAHKGFDGTELVLVQGGGNDFLDAFQNLAGGDPESASAADDLMEELVRAKAAAMVTQLKRLAAAGAKRIVYVNLPDLGMLPFIRNTELEDLATEVSEGYNELVASGLAGTNVQVFDLAGFIDDVVDDPAAAGLTVTDKPACRSPDAAQGEVDALLCARDTLVEPDADRHYLFADSMHPTAAGHRLWGEKVAGFIHDRFGTALRPAQDAAHLTTRR
ncbi:hypothetical protein CDO44_26755 [Pigmentiphaga sp. NML080357]|nr:hypothetical protein CDO44_26755 [Pigmentiphaga sp. NML080357]